MTNCEWLNSKLEAYFCDNLSGDELGRFQTHMASCPDCRREVESLKRIDPLLRGVLQHRLAIAQAAVHANGRPRVFKLLVATGALAAVIALAVIGIRSPQQTPAPPVTAQAPAVQTPIEPDGVKKNSTRLPDVNLGKPLDGAPVRPVSQPQLDEPLANGPDFMITEVATGYTATLETYRGRVVLFGVVSPEQKAALTNLDQIYEAYGANGRVAIFAVARHRGDEFRGLKIPVFNNNGSRLLGAGEGEFRLVDATGKTKLEGSLADPVGIARIRSELGQLGIRQ